MKMDLNGEMVEEKSLEKAEHGFIFEAQCVRDCLLKGITYYEIIASVRSNHRMQ